MLVLEMSHRINKNNCETNYISKCWDFIMERKGYITKKIISRLLEYLMIQSVKGGVFYENIGNIFKFLIN